MIYVFTWIAQLGKREISSVQEAYALIISSTENCFEMKNSRKVYWKSIQLNW